MRWTNPVLCPLLALALGTATLPLAPTASAAPSRQEKKALDDAGELYKQGRTKFEMAEYKEAIALWKEAYAKLPDTEEARPIKNDVVYNISEAQIRAYEIDKDLTHLRKAKVLLADYLRNHEALYGDGKQAVEERASAQARLEEVEHLLDSSPDGGAAAGSGDGDADDPDAAEAAGGAEPPPKELSPDQKRAQEERAAREARLEEIQNDPELRQQDTAARKRIVTGAVLGGIGITFAVGAWFALSLYSPAVDATPDPGDLDPVDDPEPNNAALITGISLGVVGLGLLGAGAGLFGSGMKARKRLRTPSAKPSARVTPWLGPTGGGASLQLRF